MQYENDKLIKIILLYEDYFDSDMLNTVFNMPENQVRNDGWYWCLHIRDFEILLFLYRNNPSLFYELMDEKIRRTTEKSKDGQDFELLFAMKGINRNPHLFQKEHNYFDVLEKEYYVEIDSSSNIEH